MTTEEMSLSYEAEFENRLNLSAPLFLALTDGFRRTKSDAIRVTSLIKPPMLYQLERRFADRIREDAADRVWALQGSAIHFAIARAVDRMKENGTDLGWLSEHSMAADVSGTSVTGTCDLYCPESETLWDFKFTSAWSVVYGGGVKPEWEKQMNCYAWLLRREGREVSHLMLGLLLRDWSKQKARDASYPEANVIEIRVPLWSDQQAQTFIQNSVNMHRNFDETPIPEIPVCSESDRWAKPTTYAVKREGRKTALKVHSDPMEARRHVEEMNGQKPGHFLEVREGESTRCKDYCAVAAFCPFGRKVHNIADEDAPAGAIPEAAAEPAGK